LFNRVIPVTFDETSDIQVESFAGSLYLLDKPAQTNETFKEIINLHEQLIPLTAVPLPQCLLKRDLALLYVLNQDFLSAEQWFEDAQKQCPSQISSHYAGQDFVLSIYPNLIKQFERQGQQREALLTAGKLFQIDAKNEIALHTLAIFDVLAAFENGALLLADEQASEPVQIRRFSMPQNGDWGDVLLTHAPASVAFELQLPEEPALFYSRVAMSPDSWQWGGDGSEFVVEVQTENSPAQEVYRQYVSNLPPDQRWHEVKIPLHDYAGQTVTVTLSASPGMNGDFTGDWAGWASPFILWDVGQ
jgi:hypothetical protein